MKFHQRLLGRYMITTIKGIVDPFYGVSGFPTKTTTKVGKNIHYEDIQTK